MTDRPIDLEPPPRTTRMQWAMLGMIVAFAGAVRIYQLGVVGFWFDELASVALACGHWQNLFFPQLGFFQHAPDLASHTAIRPLYELFFEVDSHPPLYAFLLRMWWLLFGMSDVSCRALSVAASLLAIVAVFDVGRLIVGPTVGLWAAAMLAASPTQVRYAQEARSYAILVFFGAMACDAVLRIYRLGPTRQRWIMAALLTTLTALTHYFVAGAVAGLAIFALLRLTGRTRIMMIAIVAAAFTILIATRLPIIVTHMNVMSSSVHYLDESRKGLIGRTLGRATTVPMWLIMQPRDNAMAAGFPAVLLLLLPFFLDRLRPGYLLCGLWGFGVIGLVAASDIILAHNALTYIRYTIAAAPMVVVSAAVMADLGGKWTRHLLPALAVVGGALGIPATYHDEIWEKTEARQWAADIRSHVAPEDILVLGSRPDMGLYSAGLEYLNIAYYAYPLACPVAIIEDQAGDALKEEIWTHRRVWVALCYHSSIGQVLGGCHIVEDGPVRFGAGKVVLVERDNPATQPSASRHST